MQFITGHSIYSSGEKFAIQDLFNIPGSTTFRWILISVWIGLSIVYGFFSAERQVAHGDLFVFYTSGIRFISGESLYAGKASGLTFMYPPFAAAVHQVLALFGLKTASGIFACLNLVCLGIVFLFTRNWFRLRWHFSNFVILSAWMLTIFYFFLNLELGQNNIFLLFLTLLSIELWLRNQWVLAGLLLCMVIFFKLTALFLLAWMVLRGSVKFLRGILIGMAFCLVLPVLFRGFEQSIQDWQEFHFYFFRYMLAGHVYTDLRNQNLAATLLRLLCEPLGRYPHAPVSLFAFEPAVIKSLVKIFQLAVLFIIAGWSLMFRFRNKPIGLAEPALYLCLSQLFSGLTWNQHMVMLLPVTIVAIHELWESRKLLNWIWIIILIGGSLSSKLFLGTQIQVFAYSVGLYTWILFFSSLFLVRIIYAQSKVNISEIKL